MIVQTVPDTASLTIPGAPVITFTDYERAIAALPGLTYYIDPASPGADRVSGAVYIPRDGGPFWASTVSANMNGQPAWDMNNTLLQFRLPPFSAKNSFTWLFAAYPTVIGGLTTLEGGALNGFNKFWWHNADTMRFWTSNTSGVHAQAQPGTVLQVGTRGLLGVSFDYATRKSSILFTDHTWSPEFTHTAAFDVEADPDARLVVGFGGGTNAMQGLLGDALYFDRALHLAPNAAVFDAARDAMVTKYAIA